MVEKFYISSKEILSPTRIGFVTVALVEMKL